MFSCFVSKESNYPIRSKQGKKEGVTLYGATTLVVGRTVLKRQGTTREVQTKLRCVDSELSFSSWEHIVYMVGGPVFVCRRDQEGRKMSGRANDPRLKLVTQPVLVCPQVRYGCHRWWSQVPGPRSQASTIQWCKPYKIKQGSWRSLEVYRTPQKPKNEESYTWSRPAVGEGKSIVFDFKNAFTQASLLERLYLEFPPGYLQVNLEYANKVIWGEVFYPFSLM